MSDEDTLKMLKDENDRLQSELADAEDTIEHLKEIIKSLAEVL